MWGAATVTDLDVTTQSQNNEAKNSMRGRMWWRMSMVVGKVELLTGDTSVEAGVLRFTIKYIDCHHHHAADPGTFPTPTPCFLQRPTSPSQPFRRVSQGGGRCAEAVRVCTSTWKVESR